MNDSVSTLSEPRRELARSIGFSAFIYGYPLVETMRTCRLQTGGGSGTRGRAPIDTLQHNTRPWTDEDRDIVTPANDLLYTTGWIHLRDGPRLLHVPSAARHPGRYFVLALYDAYTENFENLGPRNCRAEGETVVLVAPGREIPAELRHLRAVRCPTDLVWLLARVLVADEEDLPAARALQAEMALECAPGTAGGSLPLAVARWDGEPVDAMAMLHDQALSPADVAPGFFTSLVHALADAPGRTEDAGLVAWLGQAGLQGGAAFRWDTLEPTQRDGLTAGLAEASELVAAAARSRRARPWVLASRAGVYGSDYLTRALTAYIGLGALATSEAIYGAGHFDADHQPLEGRHRYTLRFAADAMPPAQAFWSVTLYDQDRFLYRNAIGRHAIGDRTRGLKRDGDGGLTITFSHERPEDAANWLPTPAARFYLIMRLYHPRDGARSWKAPALQRMVEAPATRSPDALTRARQAVTWAWPLYEMARMRASTSPRRHQGEPAGPDAESPLRWCNVLVHGRELLAPGTSRVVTPNVDTLYSNAWLDLSEGPLVIDVPDTAGRYYVLGLLDFYTNPFAGIGQRTSGTAAGSFLIAPTGWDGATPEGMKRIDAPTPWVWMIGRWLVEGRDDLRAVHALQDAMNLSRLHHAGPLEAPVRQRFDGGFTGPHLSDTAPGGGRFAQVVNAALAQNPPPSREHAMVSAFAAFGIGAGLVPGPAQCDLLDTALAAELPIWHQAEFGAVGPTGWQTPPPLVETFGDAYAQRAQVALRYIGALDRREALYLMLHVDGEGRALQGGQARTLRFEPGALPPVHAFWSLTMYSTDTCMLVANPIGRYAIGDRTPGLRPDPDGGLTIHIGHALPVDPAAAANWLPAPQGPYYLCLRAYVPRDAMLSGCYHLPPLRAA